MHDDPKKLKQIIIFYRVVTVLLGLAVVGMGFWLYKMNQEIKDTKIALEQAKAPPVIVDAPSAALLKPGSQREIKPIIIEIKKNGIVLWNTERLGTKESEDFPETSLDSAIQTSLRASLADNRREKPHYALKGEKELPSPVLKRVISHLQKYNINKFNLITDLEQAP